MAYRFGNAFRKRSPVSSTRLSGSHTEMPSLVSPGVCSSSRRTPAIVSARRSPLKVFVGGSGPVFIAAGPEGRPNSVPVPPLMYSASGSVEPN